MARDVVVGLLRAVNVGGRKLTSAQLRETAERLGYTDVKTYVNSGNVVLASSVSAAQVADALSAALTAEAGFAVPVITRTAREWHAIVEALPFPDEARDDPSHLVVVTWDGSVSASAQSFDPARYGPERLQWRSHELYAYYPDGQGRSKLTLPILEKAAGRRGTARNWNTALALDALVRERE
ncbi:DUF1697 domain-containing protein [Cellulomonas persica]|uniref:DUF1697 domain-containing protein n=1 Tax=Cellulomonas persica TaxID=76861 RepID=A0A510UVC9_9CELL|nr:DUF1697 domain-containing protein [Cellulomonas persica]GEK17100.1 hypothetical protein CPE01_08330 [Cellulomonas persica]